MRAAVAALPDRVRNSWETDGAEVYAGPERNWVAESLHVDEEDDGESIAQYLVTMQPNLGLLVADWLEDAAALHMPSHVSFKVAYGVLGKAYPGGGVL